MPSKLANLGIAGLIAIGITACSFFPKVAYIQYLADPQGPLILLMVSVMAVLTFLLCFPLAYWALSSRNRGRKIAVGFLVILLGFILYSDFLLYRSYRALQAARDPATSAEELLRLGRLLAEPSRQELDNRLARHPNSPEELLRLLATRKGQTGTLVLLAANPKTPIDVLEALSRIEEPRILEALQTNEAWKKRHPQGGLPESGRLPAEGQD